MKRKRSTELQDVAEDAISHIFRYFTLKEILWPLSTICKQWLRCTSYYGNWKHVQMQRIKPRIINNIVKRYGTNIITLDISHTAIPKYLMKTLLNCNKLRKLQLGKAWASSVVDDSFCTDINQMNLEIVSIPKKAKISDYSMKQIASSTIEELSITHNLHGTSAGYTALSKSTHLKHLILCNCRQLDNRALKSICKLPLITLDVSFTSISKHGIAAIATDSVATKTLQLFLFNGIYVPRETLLKIGQNMKLKALSLSHIMYEEEDLSTLRQFDNVEQLYMSAFEITDDSAKVIGTMTKLREIYIFCNEISMQSAIELQIEYKVLMYKPLGLTHHERNTLKESGVIFM